jgi:hypothetical protein
LHGNRSGEIPLLFTGRHFWKRRCRKKTWWQQEFFMIEAKAQGDYADRKGTVQNGEKKQFVG